MLGRAEINVAFVDVENVLVGQRAPEQVTGGTVDDALTGLPVEPEGVQDEQGNLPRSVFSARTIRRCLGH